MRRIHIVVLVLVALFGAPAVGFAQWLRYPTEGVPRKSDGKPDLTAPTPRLPNGKPDFSGIWHAGNRNPCKLGEGDFIDCTSEIGGSPLARNLGNKTPGGLPYQPWAAEVVKKRTAELSIDDPHVQCLPDNPPRTWNLPHLTKIIHQPKLVVLLYEVNAMYRQIFVDGRPLPPDMAPGWNGYSIAHWEGDTLVVQTAGFRDGLWLDTGGSPLSDVGKMTEKIRRPNYGTLEIELTVDDPKTYTRPWTIQMVQNIELDTELVDEFCLEGEKAYDRMPTTRGT